VKDQLDYEYIEKKKEDNKRWDVFRIKQDIIARIEEKKWKS
jgi:hypothetical protein